MYGLAVGFILLLLFKIINSNCLIILGFFLLFFGMILYQLFEFKKKANEAFCPVCKEGTLCKLLCESKITTSIVSVFIAAMASLSMLSFLYTISYWFYAIIIINLALFYKIYTEIDKKLSTEFTVSALGFFKEISVNFINILFLLISFILISFISIDRSLDLNPELFAQVNEEINHGCVYFQHLVRTTYFFDLFTQSLINLEGVGNWVFAFFYIASLSLFPFFAITMIYKFSYNAINPEMEKLINKFLK